VRRWQTAKRSLSRIGQISPTGNSFITDPSGCLRQTSSPGTLMIVR
jgi:hypothetical protein